MWTISVDLDTVSELLIKYSAFVIYQEQVGAC